MEYKVLQSDVLSRLNEMVNNHLTEGWELWGDFVVVVDKMGKTNFFQAMTKTKK